MNAFLRPQQRVDAVTLYKHTSEWGKQNQAFPRRPRMLDGSQRSVRPDPHGRSGPPVRGSPHLGGKNELLCNSRQSVVGTENAKEGKQKKQFCEYLK